MNYHFASQQVHFAFLPNKSLMPPYLLLAQLYIDSYSEQVALANHIPTTQKTFLHVSQCPYLEMDTNYSSAGTSIQDLQVLLGISIQLLKCTVK